MIYLDEATSIDLFGIDGSRILSIPAIPASLNWQCKTLPQGAYILIAKNPDHKTFQKVITKN